jgi:hypothetical protein
MVSKLLKGERFSANPSTIYLPSQLLAHGWWFSPGTPASSTTKTGRHDIADILLKVALNTINQSVNICTTQLVTHFVCFLSIRNPKWHPPQDKFLTYGLVKK